MNKRVALIGLILFALFLFGLGGYFLWKGYQGDGALAPAPAQPPSLPDSAGRAIPPGSSEGIRSAPAPTAATNPSPELSAEARLMALENSAKNALERFGSGSSADGFLGYDDIRDQVTPGLWAELDAERQALRRDHPATGLPYGRTVKAVSSDSRGATFGDPSIVVTVQVLESTDEGNASAAKQARGRKATVSFVRQADGSYLMDKVVWSDVAL